MERKCGYRNCNEDISQMRPNAKFCSRSCKSYERKYIKRKQILLKKYKESELDIVKFHKEVSKLIKGEYKI